MNLHTYYPGDALWTQTDEDEYNQWVADGRPLIPKEEEEETLSWLAQAEAESLCPWI